MAQSTLTFDDVAECEVPAREIVPLDGEGMFRLRDYQRAACDAVFDSLNKHASTLVVMATGLGKTVLFSEVALRWPTELGRVLVIAHREELIFQAAEKIGHHTDDTVAIEMGEYREQAGMMGKSKVLVASVQTLSRPKRIGKFDPQEFGLIVIDEAHHATAGTYQSVVAYFSQNPKCRILGVTATPKRKDGKGMGLVFAHDCYKMDMRRGIDAGWLVPIQQRYIVVQGLDFSNCKRTAGDLNEKDLSQAMMGDDQERAERMLHAVVAPTVKEAQGRPTLVFGVTVDHATRLTEIFNRYPGVTAECVTGTTPSEIRKEIIGRYKAGTTQVLVGVGVFTEGFDAVETAVVAIARPTSSEGLYVQMIGRGTRPLAKTVDLYDTPEHRREAIANSRKSHVTVLDFVGNSGRHKLVSAVDVLAGEMDADVLLAVRERLSESAGDVDKVVSEEKEKKRQEALKRKADREAERKRFEEQRRKEREEWARKPGLRAEVEYRAEDVCPFDAGDVAERVQAPVRGGATEGQIAFLEKLGVPREKAMQFPKARAGKEINDRKNRKGGEYIVTFGKHQGKALKDIPPNYVRWMLENLSNRTDIKSNWELYQEARSEVAPF